MDGRLLWAAVLAVATAVIAVSALSLPWVHATVTIAGERRSRTIADLTLRAFDSYGGTLAIVVAAAMALLGLLWFWYGMDVTNRLPPFAHPMIAIVVGVAGWAAIGASMLGSFFWERGLVASAPETGVSSATMQAVLDDVSRRVVEIERLAGCQRFGVAATAAVVAGVVGLWSQRPRRVR